MAKPDEPLTKGDIAQLLEVVQRVDQRMNRLEHKVEEFKDETTRHFDVIVEDLRHDLIGARSDEVEVLKDGRRDHEKRIRRLEKSAGLIAA
jgi:hypothetical protein